MFKMVLMLQDLICRMGWTYLITDPDDLGFITSDNPVCLFDPAATPPGAIGFASSPAAHFIFPISRTVCLLAQHARKDDLVKLTPARVRAVNQAIISRADMQLYASYASQGIQKLLDNLVSSRPKPTKVHLKKGRVVEE
jgi:hypothetical protein